MVVWSTIVAYNHKAAAAAAAVACMTAAGALLDQHSVFA